MRDAPLCSLRLGYRKSVNFGGHVGVLNCGPTQIQCVMEAMAKAHGIVV